MGNKEKVIALLDIIPEHKIGYVLAYVQGLTADDDAADDAFCEALYQAYQADPDKGDTMTEEELCRELGIAL